MQDEIVVTDWNKVEPDDFYLSDDWLKEIGSKKRQKELIEMAKEGNLYVAFRVPAKSYALYSQMDAFQIFINSDGDEELGCESEIIENNHQNRWEVEY